MKNIKYIKSIIAIAFAGLIAFSCSDEFLDFDPKGVVSSDDLNTPENVEAMIIAAYASMGNDGLLSNSYQDLWQTGSVRADDAYKAGGSIGDQIDAHFMEVFTLMQANNGHSNQLWSSIYSSISRINDAMRRVQLLDGSEFPLKDQRIGELRFLRGHIEFILKKLYKFPIFIDETVPKTEVIDISNREHTDQEGWQLIVDEFRAAMAVLPDLQMEEGRPTKNAARAYLAKVLLFKAYVQGDDHQVTSINASELQEVVTLIDQATGEYDLNDDYAKNFLWEFESGIESVWAIMRSIDDGSVEGRGNFSTGLNSPMIQGYGCCSFNQSSQNLINAYKTDANGLPLFDTFNSGLQIQTLADVMSINMDPRLAHTIGIIGLPWKYDVNRIFDETYARVPGIYGFNMGMKDQELPECSCFRQYTAFFSISRNTDQMRWAEVLLWKAEALIELGRMAEALPIINAIRARAISPESLSRLKFADGSATGNWVVGQYSNLGDQENARKILRFERRVELAFEHKRFFDLVRWGITEPTLNAYFADESQIREHLNDAMFTAGRDEYLPIPQQQITISRGLYQQNPGYN